MLASSATHLLFFAQGRLEKVSVSGQAAGGQSSQLPSAGPRALLTTPAGVPFSSGVWSGAGRAQHGADGDAEREGRAGLLLQRPIERERGSEARRPRSRLPRAGRPPHRAGAIALHFRSLGVRGSARAAADGSGCVARYRSAALQHTLRRGGAAASHAPHRQSHPLHPQARHPL
eukprot:1196374-Prorocentrum_minimum.AAC.6